MASSGEPAPSSRSRSFDVPDGYLLVARVLSPHGIKGELGCQVVTDFPERFEPGRELFVGDPPVAHRVTSANLLGDRVILHLSGIPDRNAAEELRGALILVPESAAVDLPDGEYYWHQVIGLRAETSEGAPLGVVADILETGANHVYVVRSPNGDMLVPAIKQMVKQIDPASGRIVIDPLPGMEPEPRRAPSPRPRRGKERGSKVSPPPSPSPGRGRDSSLGGFAPSPPLKDDERSDPGRDRPQAPPPASPGPRRRGRR